MDNETLSERLDSLRQQGYPLEVTTEGAEALVEGIRRIMAAVPEDQQIFLRADYDLVTSALFHPEPPSSWEPESSDCFGFPEP